MEKAKEHTTGMAKIRPNTLDSVAPVNTQTCNESEASTTLINNKEHEQEGETLKEELEVQEAPRSRERDQKKAAKEEKRRIEETPG